jgi:hypothetical protein
MRKMRFAFAVGEASKIPPRRYSGVPSVKRTTRFEAGWK